jgi:uncharacterized protein YcbK (DUF882 family)
MKLTENFDIKEWRCHDGTDVPYNLVDNVKALAVNLQVLRETVGRPVNIISGYRNPSYNKRIGGAKRSYHMKAMAADIRVKGMTPAEVKAAIEGLISDGKMEQGGLGLYKSFVHYDNRGRRARWGR